MPNVLSSFFDSLLSGNVPDTVEKVASALKRAVPAPCQEFINNAISEIANAYPDGVEFNRLPSVINTIIDKYDDISDALGDVDLDFKVSDLIGVLS